jgi:hypothetical protein
MSRLFSILAVAVYALAPAAVRAQDTIPRADQPPVLRDVRIVGSKELSVQTVREAVPGRVGEPFTETPEHVAETIERLYREEGYTFARAKADFDQASGALTITIEEGVIDAIEFEGVDEKLARTFTDEFAVHPGDVFNRRRARQALNALLGPTRGAVTASRVTVSPRTFTDTRQLRGERRATFDLVEENGRRILRIGLAEHNGRFKLAPDLGDREDWFTAVDGFVPSLGFGAAVFDRERFNHAYVAGHLSIKAASGNVGYALGFERPFFGAMKVYVGGELHDLTASDDLWQVSSTEASLAALGPRRSYRDYYRRRGVQLSTAVRLQRHAELLFAWRTERHEPLAVESDFSLWNDDEPFRPNRPVRDGRLNTILIGGSLDGLGFDRESLEATYRRHQLEAPFGERIGEPKETRGGWSTWRIDWTSEISEPGAFGSDFDFRRHIVSGRARAHISPHQEIAARVIGGWSDGVLPPQREFAIGGIGSVHGYGFKESVGDTLRLINLEYGIGWHGGPQLLGFFDAGRTWRRHSSASAAVPGSAWLKGVGWGIGLGAVRIDFGYKLDDVPKSLQVLLRFGHTF